LPTGLTLAAGTGAVTGTPTSGGVFTFTARVTDSASATLTQSCSITVSQPPTIASAPTATFAEGTAGSFSVTASGYPAPTFTAAGLPAGLSLSSAGLLSGTPAAGTAGNYSITVTAANGIAPDATQSLQLSVVAATQSLTISPASVTFGTVKQYSFAYNAVTLSNTGSGPILNLRVSLAPATGTPARNFAALNFCGAKLAAGKQCKIYVVLIASDPGALNASLNIAASAGNQFVQVSAQVVKRTQ
jgi:hypothetical protein